MPTTENSRLNQQQPVLENPSLPDHDRRRDEGMHAAVPTQEEDAMGPGALDESEIAPPDQEFSEVLQSGADANQGLIHEDPNNWLTSDRENPREQSQSDLNPEDRGESLPDIMDGDKH